MKVDDVIEMLKDGEGERVEFKLKVDPIAHDVCAFLNIGGGTVLCGVTDSGQVSGVDPRRAIQRVSDVLQKIEPTASFRISKVKIDERTIVAVQVEPSPHLHSVSNVAHVRAGANNRPLSIRDVVERASESLFVYFDEQPSTVSAREVDRKAVRRFLDERERIRGVRARGSLDENLRRLKIATSHRGREVLTYAGLLMFGRRPGRHLAQARVTLVCFTDSAGRTYSDSRQFDGPVCRIIDDVASYLAANLRELGGQPAGFRRGRLVEYPLPALREAVVNALAHRNYLDPSDTKIFLAPGEIRIKNPGSFPPGVTPDDPEHKPRNPLLSSFLYDLGYVERYGFGIARIREECAAHPLVDVSYRLGALRTEVVFTQESGDLGLDSSDHDVLLLLGARPAAASELAAHLEVSRQAVNQRMKKLMRLGLVERTGRGRATRYRLSRSADKS